MCIVLKYGKLEKPVWDVFSIGKAFSFFEMFVAFFTPNLLGLENLLLFLGVICTRIF